MKSCLKAVIKHIYIHSLTSTSLGALIGTELDTLCLEIHVVYAKF